MFSRTSSIDQHTFWPVVFVVTISYAAPLLVVTLYNKGERFERERLK